MRTLLENFSTQLKEALEIGENAKLTEAKKPILNVVIAGMGGSGIGGTIAGEIAYTESTVPISSCKNYFIPEYVKENSLLIVSSYSGNTEESIKCMKEAQKRGAKIACITSGGKISEMAEEFGADRILIPGGMPPRACLGYSLVEELFILNYFGLLGDHFKEDLKNAIKLLNIEEKNIQKEAEEVAQKLFDKLPIIYSVAGKDGPAIRFKQQLNENAKMLSWHSSIPEMNHNELLGWHDKNEALAAVIFRDDFEYSRIEKRIEFTKATIQKYTNTIIEIYSKGESPIERIIYNIHFGDWVSVFLSEKRNVDPDDFALIEYLKKSLGEFTD